LFASAAISVRRGERCTVVFDGEDWVHRYRDGVVVDTAPTGYSASLRDAATRDAYFYMYVPEPGDVVVDIGAGVGGEVRVFSRAVGPTGRVLSVEPHPRVFRCLEKTVALNRLANVQTVRCAVTARSSLVKMRDHANHIGNVIDDGGSITVAGKTLAEILASYDINRVGLMTMNIEGSELTVLDASRDALRLVEHAAVSCHDFVRTPGSGNQTRTYDAVRSILEETGFRTTCRPKRDRKPWLEWFLYASRTSDPIRTPGGDA
jgi:FkbM family methyltransferase